MALRTRRRSRPLSVRPAPSRTEKDAAARSRPCSTSWGGTQRRPPAPPKAAASSSARSSCAAHPLPAYSAPRILDQSGMLTGTDAGPGAPAPTPRGFCLDGAATGGDRAYGSTAEDRNGDDDGEDDAGYPPPPPQMTSASSSSTPWSAPPTGLTGVNSRCDATMERLLRPAILSSPGPGGEKGETTGL
uniref:Uncharacterized protein n=1 Tax=Zea mays TaxID=4577 RepID=B8A1X0_MAIZE|nr:unknown [Zea mays]